MKFKKGQIVQKRSNSHVLYVIDEVRRNGKIDIKPINSYTADYLLFPGGYPAEKLVHVSYNVLCLSYDNMTRVSNSVAMRINGTIYVSYNDKQIAKIADAIETNTLVKVYTTRRNTPFEFIHIDDIRRVIHVVKQRGKLVKMPAYRVEFHNV